MVLRVGQWATGNVGKPSLASIIGHPDLELVGLVVTDPAKAGKDAAELCGLDKPTGIKAILNGDELIAMKPDCISYCAAGTAGRKGVTGQQAGAVNDLCKILAAGINVVSTSLMPFVHPASADPEIHRRLTEACEKGNSSIYTSGMDPGFVHEIIPLCMTGVTRHIDSIKVSEIMCYANWNKYDAIVDKFSIGRPMTETPALLKPGIPKSIWGAPVQLIAEQLGVKFDRLEEYHELLEAHETFRIPATLIKKGTIAGMRFGVRAMIGDREVVTVEHVTRFRYGDAPHWPKGTAALGDVYRVEIIGEPNWQVDITNPGQNDPTVPCTIATALRIVNAIPALCAARPGVLTAFDMGHIIRRGLIQQ